METKHLVLLGLAVADIPAYVFLFKLLFKGAGGGKLPRLGEIFASENFKDRGGEMKLLLLVTASALLVLAEYLAILSLFPGLAGAK
ncbi:MAG TPA: hypothetical protein PLG14_06105 [Spirochaetales bacterium]|nr:hypothetical protein [Spirochaetales bacterium]